MKFQAWTFKAKITSGYQRLHSDLNFWR